MIQCWFCKYFDGLFFLIYGPWIQVIVNTDELNQIVEATGASYDQANQAYIVSQSADTDFFLKNRTV